jgi:hypothetical protein
MTATFHYFYHIYSSPAIFVKKKDGSLRFCIDYRMLNTKTIKDTYPLPHIDEILDSVGGCRYFSTLDTASGFWQTRMDDDSIKKTGFVTKYGTLEFLVMPFGLMNAPATFQRLMTQTLRGLLGSSVFVFMDDILVCSRALKEHVAHLRQVFQALETANVRLK